MLTTPSIAAATRSFHREERFGAMTAESMNEPARGGATSILRTARDAQTSRAAPGTGRHDARA